MGDHGQHVDNRALAPGRHRGREFAGQDERRLDVHGVDRVDALVGGALGRAEREHAGVVDQDVDVPATEFDGAAGQRPHRVGVGQVRGDEVGPSPGDADLRHDRIAALRVPAADQDVCAAPGQQDGGGPSDAAGRAGHQRGLPGQVRSTSSAST
jgi:hypothetical protein